MSRIKNLFLSTSFLEHENFLLKIFSVRRRHSSQVSKKLVLSTSFLIRSVVFVLVTMPFLAYAQLPSLTNICDPISNVPCDFRSLISLANTIIKFFIILGSSVFAIMFSYAGYLFLTANGSSGQLTKAKGFFWDAILGFVIMLSAWLFVDFILTVLVKNNPEEYRILSK